MRKRWALVAAVWTAVGLFQAFLWVGLVETPVIRPMQMLPLSLATAWLWAALTPLIARAVRLIRWERGQRARYAALHLTFATAAAVLDALVRREILDAMLGTPGSFLEVILWRLDLSLFSYFAVVSIVHAIDYQRLYRERKLRAAQLRAQLARAQLQVLTVQLRPHFLFNTLHTISELVHRDPQMAERVIHRLGDLLHLSLEHGHRQEVTLRTELSLLEAYLDIQRTRFRERLTIQLDVEPALLDACVPHFLLQPLVENAIRHGVAPRPEPGLIRIEVRAHDQRLEVEIRDNGVGLGARHAAPVEGIGLRNTRARLRQLYGVEQRMELHDAPGGGAVVTLAIPLRVDDGADGHAPRAASVDAPEPDGPSLLVRTGEWSIGGALALESSRGPALVHDDERDSAREDRGDSRRLATSAEELTRAQRLPLTPRTALARAAELLGIWTLIGLFWTEQAHLFIHTIDQPVPPFRTLAIFYFSIAGIWAVLTPFLVLVARRLPVGRANWRWAAALHVCIAIAVSVGHLALHRLVYPSPVGGPLINVNNLPQFYWNLSSYMVILALTHARDFARAYRERQLQAGRLEAELANAELRLVTLQLHPAFLFTTLDAITAFARTDPARADRMIVRLGDLLRLMLQDIGAQEFTLERELEFIETYLSIQRMRFNDALLVELRVHPDALDARVPRLVLNSLVVTTLEHGDPHSTAPRRLEIEAERRQEQLVLRVRGEAAGGRPAAHPIRAGAALRAVRARLEQVVGSGHRLDAETSSAGIQLTLVIPYLVDATEARAAS